MAMLAAMLRLPDENYLYEQFSPVDVDAIGRALEELAAELARAHASEWQRLLERTAAAGAYRPDPVAMARRALQREKAPKALIRKYESEPRPLG